MRVGSLEWMAGVLAGLDCGFTILSPDELRASVRGLADRLAAGATMTRGRGGGREGAEGAGEDAVAGSAAIVRARGDAREARGSAGLQRHVSRLAGPAAAIGSIRFVARSSIPAPIPSAARSTTTASTSPCATTGPNAARRRDARTASSRSKAGRSSFATPRGTRGSVRIGHFGYGHIDAVVLTGEFVVPGQHIGWTCDGDWHVHLSEFVFTSGAPLVVNPLRRDGKLHPFVDRARPAIREIRFYSPATPAWARRPRRASRAFRRRESASTRTRCPAGSTCASE